MFNMNLGGTGNPFDMFNQMQSNMNYTISDGSKNFDTIFRDDALDPKYKEDIQEIRGWVTPDNYILGLEVIYKGGATSGANFGKAFMYNQ